MIKKEYKKEVTMELSKKLLSDWGAENTNIIKEDDWHWEELSENFPQYKENFENYISNNPNAPDAYNMVKNGLALIECGRKKLSKKIKVNILLI